MLGEGRLAQVQQGIEFANRALGVDQQAQDYQPLLVGQDLEQLGGIAGVLAPSLGVEGERAIRRAMGFFSSFSVSSGDDDR